MGIGLLGKKVGMTRFFTENGESIPVTVLKIEDNIISMIKSLTAMVIMQFKFQQRNKKKINQTNQNQAILRKIISHLKKI